MCSFTWHTDACFFTLNAKSFIFLFRYEPLGLKPDCPCVPPVLTVAFILQVKRKEPQELEEDESLKRVRPSTPPDEEDEGEMFRLLYTSRATTILAQIPADSHCVFSSFYI